MLRPPDNSHLLAPSDFARVAQFIEKTTGIQVPPGKKTMVEGRLRRRMRALGLDTMAQYCRHVFEEGGFDSESTHLIDAVTTNKTDFFREPQHFEYLLEYAVPNLIKSSGAGIRGPLMVWSAACSSGEEPYTLAMILDVFSQRVQGFKYMVLGTDISTRMIETARLGIYDEERVVPIPVELRRKYLMRSKDKIKGVVRIVPELRAYVKFRRLNFMDGDFGMREKMDIIFCRNVLIYFDRPTQEKVINRLCKHLNPGGYLFTGHSETLSGMDLPLEKVANTVSRRL